MPAETPTETPTETNDILLQDQKNSHFHIHLDGAVFPPRLAQYAREKYGFFDDDFDHQLVVELAGELRLLPAKQLTLKIDGSARI
jgi:hypothetical protein